MAEQNHLPRRRRFPKGTPTQRVQLFVRDDEFAELVELAVDRNTSLSEMMTTATLAPSGGISRAEKGELVTELIATREDIGSLVLALRSAGSLTEEDRARLRRLDTRLFNVTEHLT